MKKLVSFSLCSCSFSPYSSSRPSKRLCMYQRTHHPSVSRTPYQPHIYSSATPFIGSAFVLSFALTILLSPSRLNLFFTLPERPLCAVVGLSALSSMGRGAVVFADVELCTELLTAWLTLPDYDAASSEGADTDVPFALGTLVVEFLMKLKLRSERGLGRGSEGGASGS